MRGRKLAYVGLVALAMTAGATSSCTGPEDGCDTLRECPPGGSAGSSGSSGDAGDGNAGTGGSKGGAGSSGSTSGGKSGSSGSSSGGSMEGGLGGAEGGVAGAPVLPCNGACTADKPVCKESTDTCVECLQPSDCNTTQKTKCDTATNACVECLGSADCTDAKAAKCSDGACVKCTTNDDCTHLGGNGVCDTKSGECVQCTLTDDTACGGKSCDPATSSCTKTTKGTVANCKPCLADSECAGGNQADPDARCVPMEFQGVVRPGGFCLRRVSKTCARPYTIGISAKSLSGAAAENYCGIDQDNVTCEAVVDLEDSRTCKDQPDSACGCTRDKDGNCTDTGKGGLCRDFVAVQDRCTYQCGTTDDCPTGKACLGAPIKYCQ